jgi:hypothetical protein
VRRGAAAPLGQLGSVGAIAVLLAGRDLDGPEQPTPCPGVGDDVDATRCRSAISASSPVSSGGTGQA